MLPVTSGSHMSNFQSYNSKGIQEGKLEPMVLHFLGIFKTWLIIMS